MVLLKEALGLTSTLIAVVSNGAYLRAALKAKIKPHIFSWLIWGILTGITYFAQRSANAGPGAWHLAVNSLICFAVVGVALKGGKLEIRRSDFVTFCGALLVLPLWLATASPLTAIVLVIFIEACAYFPTFRKSFKRPHEELILTYVLDTLRCLISIFAMDRYSATTLLYPLFIAAANTSLISLLVCRRRANSVTGNL